MGEWRTKDFAYWLVGDSEMAVIGVKNPDSHYWVIFVPRAPLVPVAVFECFASLPDFSLDSLFPLSSLVSETSTKMIYTAQSLHCLF